jgi:AcrR family transcriptional regulator
LKPRDDKKIEQVFQATLGLVKDKGLAGITMCEIAKEAGLATGTLYIYFKNKEELISKLFTECRRASLESYFVGYDDGLPFRDGFRVVWMNILRFRLENFEEMLLMDQFYHSPFINDCTKELTKQLKAPMYRLVDKGKEEGHLKDIDSLSLLTFMIGTIHEGAKNAYYSQKKMTKKVAEGLFNMCWDGMKA